ncbi:TetR/AcrR family transcriptional regulator [Parafrankia sp. EUN1f]|uniref:TetR/AcrR family transcriptional regulator n=1 Tax=Parafrankia sp. EUN1f TaxID=102897 RepID=UPI0001C4639D|nr:TetR/AcrR family transcriptional regulator [Parafrankia sp. EUN1f]EFC81372.1 transcriptional regulator, TetR family [Parafrankia sp. EUN1f]
MSSPLPQARPRRGGRPSREETERLNEVVREHALRLFLDLGYEGTSMDAIARAAGTTKASLYARYPSKEAVFSAVFEWAIMRRDWPVPEPPPPDLDDLEGALTAIADAAVRRAVDPTMIKFSRIAISHVSRFPELARRSQTVAVWPRQQLVADLLRRHRATGTIAADDPDALAEHFLGMVSGAPARLASFGIVRPPEEQERHTRELVRLFLRALRP